MKSVFTKKKKLEIPLPQGWHDVPYNIGLKIKTDESLKYLDQLSLLSGVDKKILRSSTDNQTIYYLANSLLFIKEYPLKERPEFPKSVLGKKMPYVMYSDTNDLGECSVGQVEDMQEFIRSVNPKTDLDVIKLYPTICAIYLQPIIKHEDYDYKKALNYAKELEAALDFKTTLNMGAFFLMRLSDLTNGLNPDVLKVKQVKKKWKQVFGNLVQRLGSILH